MRVLNDNEIQQAILDILSRDSRIDLKEINIRVENGAIYITGIVDSAAERKAVQEDLETADLNGRIVEVLTLRNHIERTDEELAAAVKQALVRDITVDGQAIKVEAADGLVTLEGWLTSYAQKRAAEDVAWWTPGVTNVASHILVDGMVEPPDEPDY